MEFYNKFISLCAQNGKAPSAVAIELGIAKSTVSGWKSGRNGATNATLKKIADYFGVTVDYLLGNEEQEKTPAPKTEREVIISEIMAFVDTLSDDDLKSFHRLIVK